MKVLFICSGDSEGNPKPVVRNQAETLSKAGLQIEFYCIRGSGIKSYISAIPAIRRKTREYKPDVIHAHYSFSGFAAYLSGAKPLVVSLMGSDTRQGKLINMLTRFFALHLWRKTIVKSEEMRLRFGLPAAEVIPNGVDTEKFRPLDRDRCLREIGFSSQKKNILFVGNPMRQEKNYSLAISALEALKSDLISITPVYNTEPERMVYYYNASNMLLLTSTSEGSPNAVKEAMSCNLPVVATSVGDVGHLLYGVDNSIVTAFDRDELASAISRVLDRNEPSNGRQKIYSLGLDAGSVASRLKDVYKSLSAAE